MRSFVPTVQSAGQRALERHACRGFLTGERLVGRRRSLPSIGLTCPVSLPRGLLVAHFVSPGRQRRQLAFRGFASANTLMFQFPSVGQHCFFSILK